MDGPSKVIRALFITRKHPPSIGGMEKLSYELISGMRTRSDIKVSAVTWGHSQWLLPAFLIIAFFRGVVVCIQGVDVIHVGDPVLAGLGLLLRAMFHVPLAITVHGLDITFQFPFYQGVIPRWVTRCDCVIAISQAVYSICLQRGVPVTRCQVIHPGVEPPNVTVPKATARQILSAKLGRDLSAKRLIISVGRLVPRKGVYFFVNEVLPLLLEQSSDYFFLVVGQGMDRERILMTISQRNLHEHVHLTGYLDSSALQNALNASDLFIAPNIPQMADIEGFGLIVLEAAASGCPVLVADIEGLRDTMPDIGRNCFVPAGDARLWAESIEMFFQSLDQQASMREAIRLHVSEHNSWSRMVSLYAETLVRLSQHE